MEQSIFESVLNKGEAMERLQSQFVEPWAGFIEKGRAAQIGEVRQWRGKKMRKTTQGWVPAEPGKSLRRRTNQDGSSFKWDGSLKGLEDYGSPEFEQDLNIYTDSNIQYKNILLVIYHISNKASFVLNDYQEFD